MATHGFHGPHAAHWSDGSRIECGPLGPESVAWELHASPAMLTAGLRALAAPALAPVDRERGRRALGSRPRSVAPVPGDGRVRHERHLRRRRRSRRGAIRRVRARARRRCAASTSSARRTPRATPRSSPTCTRRSSTARSAPADVYGPRLSPDRARSLRRRDGAGRRAARPRRSAARRGVGRAR